MVLPASSDYTSRTKGNRQHNNKLEQTNWKWGYDQKHAFATLKKKICDDVVFAFADFSKPFRLSVDAFRKGLVASLEQQETRRKVATDCICIPKNVLF